MSKESDLKLCKKLISKKLISKEQAQQAIRKQSALAKKGKDINIATILLKLGSIDEDTAKKLKAKPSSEASKKSSSETQKIKISRKKEAKPKEKTKKKKEPEVEDPSYDDDEVSNETSIQTVVSDADGRVKTCLECQSQIPLSSKDCTICGAPQQKSSQVHCPTCHRLGSTKAKHCHFCGCDIHKGSAGPKSLKCNSCKNVVLPDEAICKICGEIQAKARTITIPAIGKLSLATLLILCYSAIAFGMYTIQSDIQKTKPKPIEKPKPVEQMDSTPIEANLSSPESLKILAECIKLADDGKWEVILEKIKKANRESILDTRLLELWATALLKEKKFNLLIQLQQRASKNQFLADLATEVLVKQTRVHLNSDKIAEADKAISACLEIDKRFVKAYFWNGVVQYKKGNDSKAEDSFRKTLEMDREWYETYFFLYLLNRKNGNTDLAKKNLQTFKANVQSKAAFNTLLEKLEGK